MDACRASSMPWSQVNDRRRWVGSAPIVATIAAATASAPWSAGRCSSIVIVEVLATRCGVRVVAASASNWASLGDLLALQKSNPTLTGGDDFWTTRSLRAPSLVRLTAAPTSCSPSASALHVRGDVCAAGYFEQLDEDEQVAFKGPRRRSCGPTGSCPRSCRTAMPAGSEESIQSAFVARTRCCFLSRSAHGRPSTGSGEVTPIGARTVTSDRAAILTKTRTSPEKTSASSDG